MSQLLSSLSPEVLRFIAQSLPHGRDLANLALTSRYLLDVARPLLYQHIVLNTRSASAKDALKLITRDAALAKQCTRLTIKADHGVVDWSDEALFANLSQVQVLILYGCPLSSSEALVAFATGIRQYWTNLWTFEVYVSNGHPQQGPFGTTPLPLKGLRRVVWHQKGCFLVRSFMGVVESSCATLEHLLVPAQFDDFGCEASLPLFRLRFPNLRTFHVGTAVDPSDVMIDEPLTRFLVAHPTIDDLAIGWMNGSEWSTDLSQGHILANMLPTLRKLEVNVVNLAKLLRGGVQSLGTSLKELTVGHGLNEYPEDDYEGFRQSLEDFGGMLALESFSLNPGESMSDRTEELALVLKTVGECCPSIRKFKASWSIPIDTLAGILPAFPNLEEVLVPDWAFSKIIKESNLDLIALSCPSLKCITTFRQEKLIRSVTIERCADGSLKTECEAVKQLLGGAESVN